MRVCVRVDFNVHLQPPRPMTLNISFILRISAYISTNNLYHILKQQIKLIYIYNHSWLACGQHTHLRQTINKDLFEHVFSSSCLHF